MIYFYYTLLLVTYQVKQNKLLEKNLQELLKHPIIRILILYCEYQSEY